MFLKFTVHDETCFRRFLVVTTTQKSHSSQTFTQSLSTKIETSIIFTSAICEFTKRAKLDTKNAQYELEINVFFSKCELTKLHVTVLLNF